MLHPSDSATKNKCMTAYVADRKSTSRMGMMMSSPSFRREQDENRRVAVSFFTGHNMDTFFCVFSALRLQLDLMRALLSGNEVAWEIAQMKKQRSGRRSFHLTEIHRAACHGGLFRRFLLIVLPGFRTRFCGRASPTWSTSPQCSSHCSQEPHQ